MKEIRQAHYKKTSIKCFDALKIILGKRGFIAFCFGNVFKYLWRHEAQNDTGRIRVYDHGELVFDYSGKINIINDGRNGNAIEIEARTKEKGYE